MGSQPCSPIPELDRANRIISSPAPQGNNLMMPERGRIEAAESGQQPLCNHGQYWRMNRKARPLTEAQAAWLFSTRTYLLLNAWSGLLLYAAVRGWLM